MQTPILLIEVGFRDNNNRGLSQVFLEWSYNYPAPENLGSPFATVADGVLAPKTAAWKAFVIGSMSNVSSDAIGSLQRFANSALPVIFVGKSLGFHPTGDKSDIASFGKQLSTLQGSNNVRSVEEWPTGQQTFFTWLEAPGGSQHKWHLEYNLAGDEYQWPCPHILRPDSQPGECGHRRYQNTFFPQSMD